MSHLSRAPVLVTAVLVAVALGLLVPAATAHADPIGTVLVIPGTGSDLDPIRLRTSAGCPAQASAFYARMTGHGFPPEGQVVTANTRAGLSHSGFDVYVALVMHDYAQQNHTTLGGRYDITVRCVDRLTLQSYGELTGSLEFTSPTAYRALGTSLPAGPPPEPLALAGDGSVPAPDAQAPPAGTPLSPDPSGLAAQGVPAPATDQPQQQVESRSGRQLAAERSDHAGQGVPWPAAVGAVLVALVIGVATSRIRRRRSS